MIVSGFMSFPPNVEQIVHLNTNSLTTIIGTNYDGGPGERNGVGKTAIRDALQYLYWGRTTRMNSNQEFLNYVQRGPLLVQGRARRAGIEFYVKRGENPSILRLWEKPIDDPRDIFTRNEKNDYIFETTKTRKPDTSKRIIDLIGFDFKMFDVLLVTDPSDKYCYFEKDAEDQRDVQERVFGFTAFTEKAERLRELRKEENRNLATKEAAFIATKQANDRILAQIAVLEEKSQAWAAEKDKMAKWLTQQIRSYDGIDFDKDEAALREIARVESMIGPLRFEFETATEAFNKIEQRQRVWEHRHREELSSLKLTIARLTSGDPAADIIVLERRGEITQDISTINTEITSRNREADGIRNKTATAALQHERLKTHIADIEKQIITLDASKCPTCGQDWSDTQDHLIHCVERLEKTQQELEAALVVQRADFTELEVIESIIRELVEARNTLQAEFNHLPTTTFKTIQDASAASGRAQELAHKLTDLKAVMNPYEETALEQKATAIQHEAALAASQTELDRLVAASTSAFANVTELEQHRRNLATLQVQFDELVKSENPHRSTIDNLRDQALKHVDDSEIREMTKRIEHMSLLIKLLADKDSPIRRSLLNRYVPKLNERVNKHLETLELPQRIRFDSDMTTTFFRGNQPLSYNNLSNGQRGRAWLATNRAFREIYEMINFKINLFFVDEVLDKGMSTRGAEVAYNMLDQMCHDGKSVFLITHRQELVDMADQIMNMEYKHGLTIIH